MYLGSTGSYVIFGFTYNKPMLPHLSTIVITIHLMKSRAPPHQECKQSNSQDTEVVPRLKWCTRIRIAPQCIISRKSPKILIFWELSCDPDYLWVIESDILSTHHIKFYTLSIARKDPIWHWLQVCSTNNLECAILESLYAVCAAASCVVTIRENPRQRRIRADDY